MSREIRKFCVRSRKGCYIQLEKKAAKYILENIRASYGNTAGLVARAASFAEDSGLELTLKLSWTTTILIREQFISFLPSPVFAPERMPMEDFFGATGGYSDQSVCKACRGRFSPLDFVPVDVLPRLDNLDFTAFPGCGKRMMQMFYITVWGKTAENWNVKKCLVTSMPCLTARVLLGELLELLRYRFRTDRLHRRAGGFGI